VVTDGETGALPVASIGPSCLYTAGLINTSYALETLQLSVDDPPATMLSGLARNELTMGKPAGVGEDDAAETTT